MTLTLNALSRTTLKNYTYINIYLYRIYLLKCYHIAYVSIYYWYLPEST